MDKLTQFTSRGWLWHEAYQNGLNIKQTRLLIFLFTTFVIFSSTYVLWTPIQGQIESLLPPSHAFDPPSDLLTITTAAQEAWNSSSSILTRPAGVKIVGFVFYGRRRYVNILDCYLRKNLVKNGGYLDEVQFVVNTHDQEDINWLEQLVQAESDYKIKTGLFREFADIWKLATDDNTIYLKIDDDIVFIQEEAIPRLVHSLVSSPHAYSVMANLVNSPIAHWLHYHTDAILPYLPDTKASVVVDWRPSKLPRLPEQAFKHDTWQFPGRPSSGFAVGVEGGPPHQGHRWLPLAPTAENLMYTPIAAGNKLDAFGPGLYQWTIAAQQHYSLFEHIEKRNFGKYWTGNQQGLWNMQYSRYNLNFVAIWGSTVASRLPITHDDEDEMTTIIPRELKRPALVDTHAIVSHFSFGPQPELEMTDLLVRYRLYANEMVCTPGNQKQPV